MLLRPRTTCAQAIALLDRLTEQGLTDLQNAAPHHFIAHTADGVTEHWEQAANRVVGQYDRWTLQAAT
ncbi:hypothetical protein ACFQ7M_19260 [Streptomyces massasporeus]